MLLVPFGIVVIKKKHWGDLMRPCSRPLCSQLMLWFCNITLGKKKQFVSHRVSLVHRGSTTANRCKVPSYLTSRRKKRKQPCAAANWWQRFLSVEQKKERWTLSSTLSQHDGSRCRKHGSVRASAPNSSDPRSLVQRSMVQNVLRPFWKRPSWVPRSRSSHHSSSILHRAALHFTQGW